MITKEQYILKRICRSLDCCTAKGMKVEPEQMKNLIDQWAFDYEMEKEYRPEVLREEVKNL